MCSSTPLVIERSKRDTIRGEQLKIGYYVTYVYLVLMPLKRVIIFFFVLLKTRLFRLDPTFIKQQTVLLQTMAPNCEIIPAKSLFFKSPIVTATGYYDIETLYQT